MPEDIQSRFTVLDKPTMHPGRCAVCGAVDRPVVEFGVELDFETEGYGRLMICVTCIKQAASKFPEPTKRSLQDDKFAEAVAKAKEELYVGICGVLDSFNPKLDVSVYGTAPVVDSEDSNEESVSGSGTNSDVNSDVPGTAGESGSDDSRERSFGLSSDRGSKPFNFGFGDSGSE